MSSVRPYLSHSASTGDSAQQQRGRPLHPRASNNQLSSDLPQPQAPTSWIRSASTSSLRKLKKPTTTPVDPPLKTIPSTPTFSQPAWDSEYLITKVPKRPTYPLVLYPDGSMEAIWDPQDLRLIDYKANSSPVDDIPIKPTKSTDKISFYDRMIATSIRSSTSTKELRTSTSDHHNNNSKNDILDNELDEDVVLDVLPSFEMYNALHRHIPQGNVDPDVHELPPTYGQAFSQNQNNSNNSGSNRQEPSPMPSIFTTEIPSPISQNDSTSSVENSINNLRPLATQTMSLNTLDTITTTSNRMLTSAYNDDGTRIEDDLNLNDNIVIDKLYTLPKLSTPIDVNIKITKRVSLPPHKPEEESILKEYTSGDTIHGYCVIENKSDQPIKFEMFYVTLEAYTSVIDKKKGTRTVKRFLRMVDLSASWSYTNIDLASGFRYKCRGKDFDNSILGLNNNRILEPGVKYKKFFVFKLPRQLLDTTCKQEHFSHCLLPPSFGIDKYRNNCKYSGIRVNNILGCGHLGTKGSPILTYDMCDNELSINYTIDTRIVGKEPKTQKLTIMKEHEYNIRFIPFGFHSSLIGERNPSKQLKDLTTLVDERLKVLEKVFKRLDKNERIKNTDIHGTDLVGTIDDSMSLDSDEILQRKLAQLHIKNRLDYNEHTESPYQDIKNFEREENVIESELRYKIKGKYSSKMGIFSGFRSSSTSQLSTSNGNVSGNNDKTTNKTSKPMNNDKVGLVLVGSIIPRESLPYHSPSLLRKTNQFDKKTKQAQDNWTKLTNLLSEDEKECLTSIKLNLTCLQSNNSLEHPPPEVQSVTTELIVVTAQSENSIPIKLNTELLLDEKKLFKMRTDFTKYLTRIEKSYDKFKQNKEELNKLYNVNRIPPREQALNFSSIIPNQLYSNVESLSNLKVKAHTFGDCFKKQSELQKDNKRSSFHASGEEDKTKKWVKKAPSHFERELEVKLEYSPNMVHTLVPSFESCLCCRFYCVRIHVKFHHIGTVSIDVPVTVKNFKA